MSFITRIALIYFFLFILALLAFVKKKKFIGIILISITVLSCGMLWYLWVSSPM